MASRLRHRIAWMLRPSTTPAERQMRDFRASQAALARACSANRPTLL